MHARQSSNMHVLLASSLATDEAQTVGRKTSWAKDVWANYFLGDRRLGDKLGRYGDSKSDGWATFFRRLGEICERGETQK